MSTIYDVAKVAGVSHSTVSRVINGKSEISQKTAKKVIEAMQKVGYRPKGFFEELLVRDHHIIGLVTPTFISNPFYSVIYDNIYRLADQMGYAVLFSRMDYYSRLRSHVDFLKAFRDKVDGIIFVGQLPITETDFQNDLKELVDKNYPMVFMQTPMNLAGTIYIDTNNFQAAYEATSYLINLGHTKIAHIIGHNTNIHSVERMNGYKKALEDHGIPVDPRLIKTGHFNYNETYRCAMELIDSIKGLSAVFCGTDEMASAFIRAAKDRDIKIPDEISVVGFDDIVQETLYLRDMPSLTTLRQPRYEMSVYAVKSLIDRINGKELPQEKVFYSELIIRGSTCPKSL